MEEGRVWLGEGGGGVGGLSDRGERCVGWGGRCSKKEKGKGFWGVRGRDVKGWVW